MNEKEEFLLFLFYWHMVYGVWLMAYGIWQKWHMAYGGYSFIGREGGNHTMIRTDHSDPTSLNYQLSTINYLLSAIRHPLLPTPPSS